MRRGEILSYVREWHEALTRIRDELGAGINIYGGGIAKEIDQIDQILDSMREGIDHGRPRWGRGRRMPGGRAMLIGTLTDVDADWDRSFLLGDDPQRLSLRLDFEPCDFPLGRKIFTDGTAPITDLTGRPVRLVLEAVDE